MMFLLSSLRYLGPFQLQEARLKSWWGRVGRCGGAEVLTVDEPDGGHGDGEEEPGAHVHLDQHRRQGKEEQDDQQAAQNPHHLRDAVWKREGQSGHRWARARRGKEGEEFHPSAGQWGPGERPRGRGGRMGGLLPRRPAPRPPPPGAQMELPQQKGRDPGGGPGTEPRGGALTTGTGRS